MILNVLRILQILKKNIYSGECNIDSINCLCYGNCQPDTQTSVHHRHYRTRRNAKNVDEWPKRPNGLIYIPYTFVNQRVEERLDRVIEVAGEEFAKHTCYRLVRHTDEENYVVIYQDDGCSSYVGMREGNGWTF